MARGIPGSEPIFVMQPVSSAPSSLRDSEALEPAQRFVTTLAAEALRHRASQHPYLRALSSGTLPDLRRALRDFAEHYHGYSSHFPRYLTAVISRLDNPQHRRCLLENLSEESGQYDDDELTLLAQQGIAAEWIVDIPHPELFARFRAALGVPPFCGDQEHIEVRCWRDLFLGVLSHGSAAEAVGALGLGTEGIVQTIYQPFQQAIHRMGTLPLRDWVFFPLHTSVDDQHQQSLQRIAADFATTAEGRRDLAMGMHKALKLRDSFWSWLHERALKQVMGRERHAAGSHEQPFHTRPDAEADVSEKRLPAQP